MKAVVFHGPRDVRFESVPDVGLQSDSDAIVRVTQAAVCGSDLHLWSGGLPAAENGFVVGHEFVGVIEEVGSAVQTLRPGDRVGGSCTLGCGVCSQCRSGLYSACAVTSAGGTRTNILGFSSVYAGAQAQAVRLPFADANSFKIPSTLSDEQGLFLTDILPTADMATEFAEIGIGDSVVIFGCGPVGTLAQRCAHVRGASCVIAVDLDEGRLARAREHGCVSVHPEKENLLERVLELTGGEGADAVIEAVGRPELVGRATTLVRHGGKIAVAGVIVSPVELPWALVFMKNLTLRAGLVNPIRHIPRLLPLIESGRLDPSEIVSHRLPLAQAADAYEMFSEHRDNALKVLLEP